MRKFALSKAERASRQKLVSFTPNAILWPVLLLASLIFAQTLKMAVSHMVFVFVLLMPLGAAAQLLLARSFITTAARIASNTVEKRTPLPFAAIISNACPIPFPFIEAELLLPDERGAGCTPKRFILSLAPFSGCQIERSVQFSFRGDYSIGIRSLTVYDCFRSVKLRIPCNRYASLFVMPRRMELSPRPHSAESELDTQLVIRAKGSDNTELSDVRAYISGDSLKSVHWKLSSKSEELIVKDYSRNKGSSVCIMCDLEPHFQKRSDMPPPRTPLPEYAELIDMLGADLVIETCIASVMRELRAGNDVTLMWMADGIPVASELHSPADFDAIYRRFATVPLDGHEKQLTTLTTSHHSAGGTSLIYVTSYLDAAAASELAALALAYSADRPPELLYCADDTLYVDDGAQKKALNDCLFELERAGIQVIHATNELIAG